MNNQTTIEQGNDFAKAAKDTMGLIDSALFALYLLNDSNEDKTYAGYVAWRDSEEGNQ